jgi:alkaline phosphatase/streptomycin-6-phosphatase
LTAAPNEKRILGLFNDGNLSLEWSGDPAIPFPGSGPQRCKEFLRPVQEPALASMTVKALQMLDRADGPGFFLQVEGAQIDKQDHAAHPCEQIGETIAFDNAVKIGMDYAERHPDTLLIVTADHGHTSQIVPTSEEGSAFDHLAGIVSTLTTADKANMMVAYATNVTCCSSEHSMEHTGVQVRIAAMGPGAEQVSGLHDMTEVFHIMAKTLGLE